MPVTTRRSQRLSDADLERLLALLEGADSAELKLTVPDSERRSAVLALGMDPLDAQIRQVYFFDTPDLALNEHGLVVRARRVQQRADDSVVKLRPVIPDKLPAGLRKSKTLVVEVDAMPGGYVCSASLKGTPAAGDVKAVAAGDRPIRKLFSKQQQAFFAGHAPEGVGLDDLLVLGPELWLYPDGSRILELSTKCAPTEAFGVAAETRAFLAKQGVDLSGEQQTKTSTALGYFSRNLKATADA
jgi:hypothetical protein